MYIYGIVLALAIAPTLCLADCQDSIICSETSRGTYVGVAIGVVLFLAFIAFFVKRKSAQQNKAAATATIRTQPRRDLEIGTCARASQSDDQVPDLPPYEPPASNPLRYPPPVAYPNSSDPRYPSPPVYTPPAPQYPGLRQS